jgi:hypothetical protein
MEPEGAASNHYPLDGDCRITAWRLLRRLALESRISPSCWRCATSRSILDGQGCCGTRSRECAYRRSRAARMSFRLPKSVGWCVAPVRCRHNLTMLVRATCPEGSRAMGTIHRRDMTQTRYGTAHGRADRDTIGNQRPVGNSSAPDSARWPVSEGGAVICMLSC